MSDRRTSVALVLVGIATGLGTVDLVGIRPDLPNALIPLLITAVAGVGAALAPPDRLRPGQSRWILALFALWLGWSLVSASVSEDSGLAFATSASFLAVMLASMGVAQARSRSALLSIVAIGALVHAVAAFIVAFTVEFDQFPQRLSLVELEPNHLGRFLALLCLVAVLWALEHSLRRWGPLLALAGVSVLGLVLTGSRTAPTALVVAGFVALLAARRWKLLFVGGLAFVVGASGLIASGFDARIVELTNRSGEELTNVSGGNGRTTLWPEVLKVIEDQPLTGIGLGVDRARMAQLGAETEISWGPQHAHNLVLHLGFTTGWIGAALFLSALGLALVAALRFGEPWVAAIVAFVLVDGIAEPVFRIPQPTWALLVMVIAPAFVPSPSPDLGVAPAASEPIRRSSLLPTGPVLVPAAAVLALAIGLVWIEPGQYPGRYRCRDVPAMNAAGLLLDVDPVAGTVTTPQSVRDLPPEQLVDGSLVFSPGEDGVLLPPETARVVRCGAMREGGLTVEFDVLTFGLDTEGPGRIISIADGPEWSDIDLHIGQQIDALSLRFRQSSTYRNDGTFNGVFTDLATHSIRVTVAPDRVEIFRDGELVSTWTEFEPIKFDEWRNERGAILGNEVGGGRPFVGTLDSLRIYEGVPTSQSAD